LQARERKRLQECEHIEKYGMSCDDLWGSKSAKGVYQKSFKEVKKLLITSGNLTKEQALAVWDGYCQKRKIFNQKKINGRISIEDVYDIRSYEKFVQNCADQREEAFEQSVLDDYETSEKIYELNAQTIGYLMSQGLQPIDFQELNGNALQHQIQSEFCSVVEHAAIAARHMSYDSAMLKEILLCADAGVACNKESLMDLAIAFADTSHGLIGFIHGVSKEVNSLFGIAAQQAIESVINLPQTTVHGIISLFHFVEFVKDRVCRPFDPSAFFQEDAITSVLDPMVDGFKEDVQSLVAGYQIISEAVYNWAMQKPMREKGQDLVKMVTDFGVNMVATDAAIAKVASACKALATNLKHASEFVLKKSVLQPALEVGQDLEHFAHAKVAEKVAQAVDEVLVSKAGELEVMLVNRMESEIATSGKLPVAVASKTTMPLKDVVKRLITKGAPHTDRLFQQEVLLHFEDQFLKKEMLEFCQKAKELYTNVKVMHLGKEIDMICDIEHFATYNLKFKQNFTTGLIEGFISGGHVGILSKELEAAGKIMIKTEEILQGGARYVEYEHLFSNCLTRKTEYQLFWSGEKIMQANLEAFENQIYCEDFLRGGVKHMQIIGVSKEGLKIEMVVTEISDSKLTLDTAYPYFEQYSKIKGL